MDRQWAESVRDFADAQRAAMRGPDWTQVEAALFAMSSIDWAMVSWALGETPEAVRGALVDAARALAVVRDLAGTAPAMPVIRHDRRDDVDPPQSQPSAPAVDDSLDTSERARLAFYLSGLGMSALDASGSGSALDPRWPSGGRPAEDVAVAAIASRDRVAFLAALRDVLAGHRRVARDPMTWVSLPGLGLAARAVALGFVERGDLPTSDLLPRALVPPR